MKALINRDRLVEQSVVGRIHHPTIWHGNHFKLMQDGSSRVLPSVGGITYNVRLGDSVYGMRCDHVEPGVSLQNPDRGENDAVVTLACVGNQATVVSGDARGAKGYVTGFHGGIDHTLLYFDRADLEKMLPGDTIVIRALGQGMEIEGFPEVFCTNLSPMLFDCMGIEAGDGVLRVPVAAVVPPHLMGAGQGEGSGFTGDYDIMTADREEIRRCGLDRLRYGDLVLLQDCDNTYGRGFLRGAVSVGVIVHSDAGMMGHGPGVTTLLTCKTARIEPVLDRHANLAEYWKL